MPIFMDLHIGQGVTAEMMAKAHLQDLALQDQFKCKCLTYWFDEERGNAYCLIEAPDKSGVVQMHWNSHKQLPEEIIEVDRRIVKAFLGRLHDPEVVDYLIDQKIKVFNDPAFRVILNVETKDDVQLFYELGKTKGKQLLSKCNKIMHHCITKHNGVAAENKEQEMVVSFDATLPAILCALEIKDTLNEHIEKLNLRMSVHAGNPVDNHPELFGNTLKLVRFLNTVSKDSGIVLSSTVKELLDKEGRDPLANLGEVQYISTTNEQFLLELVDVFNTNWPNRSFDISECCKALSMSKSQLYRKSVDATSKSTNRLLQEFRLKKAKQLLRGSNRNISQIAYESGFSSPSYFTKCFHKHYGIQPSAYF